MITKFATLPPDAHVDEAVQILLHTSQGETPIVDVAGRPIDVLVRGNLIRAFKQQGPQARVAEAMTTPIPTVGHRCCLDEAFRLLQERAAPAVAVVDESGLLMGLITFETVGKMLMIDKAIPTGQWSQRNR